MKRRSTNLTVRSDHAEPASASRRGQWLFSALALAMACQHSLRAEAPGAARFREGIRPILVTYCYECHGNGSRKGGMAFDQFASDEDLLGEHDQWWAVVKNLRAGVMPPQGEPRPSAEQKARIRAWVMADVFGTDPNNPDPGRVTLRRLNRAEYQNTIRDLMGVDFKAEVEFPPDDTGYGFDNIGDVLSISPLLLEKYMQAADTIVSRAVPIASKVVRQQIARGSEFRSEDGSANGDRMTFYEPATVSHVFEAEQDGDYRLALEVHADGNFDYDPGRCKVVFKVDGQVKLEKEYVWKEGTTFHYELAEQWETGDHRLTVELEPLVGIEEKKNKLDFRILSVRVEGPLDERHWGRPEHYDRFFPDGPAPESETMRRAYARRVLAAFTKRAFRRPADEHTLETLVAIAEGVYVQSGKTFEQGIAQAMVAILSSPRFLFRIERPGPTPPGESFALVDEYALASRLSYFFWSTMPDQELFGLAERGELRNHLEAQVNRLLKDPRSKALVKSFTGQWLQSRDISHVPLNPIAIMGLQKEYDEVRRSFFRRRRGNLSEEERAKARARFEKFRPIREKMNAQFRRTLRQETEMFFEFVLREDRSILDLIDSDYTFLNETLAEHYGVPGVDGEEMRRVTLPENSPRGGVLTQATLLAVTSNPTRTSPVKRGLFILENFLGTPAPPAPASVPEFEEAAKQFTDHEPTVREILEVHRQKRLCRSCHARFDPLGMAFENFNAMGMWRDTERGQPIDASGQLITGESFRDVRDLKRILRNERRPDFYRCLTERLLVYAVGRGLEYYDEHTLDVIVERLEQQDGRFSALLMGIIESAPFQKQRGLPAVASAKPVESARDSLKPESTDETQTSE